jgi:hypothetical protein
MNKSIIYVIIICLSVIMMGTGIVLNNTWEVLAGFWQLMWAIEKIPSNK